MTGVEPDLFRVRDYVADFEAFLGEYRRRSAIALSRSNCRRNIAYGPGPTDCFDLFFPNGTTDKPRPIHMFIHGGYWRAFSKDDYAFVADAIVDVGAIAAIVDYALMPMVRMETLVDQVCRACAWLSDNATNFGGDPKRLSVSGHSAGGHLAAMCCAKGMPYRISSALPVSGLFDLAPLAKSFLQAEVQFTPDEISRFTPLNLSFDPRVRYDIMVGAEETAPFHLQADAFAEHLRAQGAEAVRTDLAGDHHMSIVLALGTPGTPASEHLVRCIGG